MEAHSVSCVSYLAPPYPSPLNVKVSFVALSVVNPMMDFFKKNILESFTEAALVWMCVQKGVPFSG